MVPAYRCCRRRQFGEGSDINGGFPPCNCRIVAEPASHYSRQKRDRIVRWDNDSFPCIWQFAGEQVRPKAVAHLPSTCRTRTLEQIAVHAADSRQRSQRFRDCASWPRIDRRQPPSKCVDRFEVIELNIDRPKRQTKALFQSQDDLYHRHGIQLFAKRGRCSSDPLRIQKRADDVDNHGMKIVSHGCLQSAVQQAEATVLPWSHCGRPAEALIMSVILPEAWSSRAFAA